MSEMLSRCTTTQHDTLWHRLLPGSHLLDATPQKAEAKGRERWGTQEMGFFTLGPTDSLGLQRALLLSGY